MTDEEKAQILIGDDAEVFKESDLGKVILGMARQDLEKAIHDFDACHLKDESRLLELKVEIRTAKRFEQYLDELITRGREVLEATKD